MQNIDFRKAALGIEFGSTRIKAALIDENCKTLACGAHEWENRFENGLWTYSQADILKGLRACYASLKADVREKYGVVLKRIGSIGISGMMHGYLAFDGAGELLTPFRTWRNNNAEGAAERLTELLSFPIPARWSVAHLYQAILDEEPHVDKISFQTTLAGYVHYLLTNEKVIGVGEASGMFPIGQDKKSYDNRAAAVFEALAEVKKYGLHIAEIFPRILLAGEEAGKLTRTGALLLDEEGDLEEGIPFCPPEGDAGTGMVASDSVKPCTGNVSAGTSVFGMIVLPQALQGVYPEIDVVTTPVGEPVAMVHCNNCTSEINAWVEVFAEFCRLQGIDADKNKLYADLFACSFAGDADCGGIVSYNYLSGENITNVKNGRPMSVRSTESNFTLANFIRSQLYAAFATLKLGMDILFKRENVRAEKICAHGGIFKTAGVCQKYLAAALNAPVTVTDTAGEGGAWGMAVLAQYARSGYTDLNGYLQERAFVSAEETTVLPDEETVKGFEKYTGRFARGLAVERMASEVLE